MKWNGSCSHCGYNYKSVDEIQFHNCELYNEKTKLDVPMNIKCHDCKINFVTMQDFQQHLCRMKKETKMNNSPGIVGTPKMTREEAIKKFFEIMYPNSNILGTNDYIRDMKWATKAITAYESLGLLHFEELKKEKEEINKLFEINERGINFSGARTLDYQKFNGQYGYVRLELWPEGLVLCVGGCIVWKSWEKYYRTGDDVTVINRTSKIPSCGKIT